MFDSKTKPSFLLVLWFALLILVVPVSAQTESARLQGTVTDPAGAAVANATVRAVDLGTNRTVEAQTNESGEFSILALQPGRYRLEITQTNFKTTQQEITLEVAQVAELSIALETGAVSETVTVTDDAPLVESSSSAIGNVINARQAVELPLNGRNVLELARLSPGVTQGVVGGFASGVGGNAETYRGGNTGGAAISVNGQRTQANNYLLDGVDNNESLVNTINVFPSAEAIQEFRVQTSVATAEFGRGGGAIINSVIKSGKNDFNGSTYLFLRNSVFDAAPTFYNPANNENKRIPEFRRGQFGGTLGGPLYLPRFGEGGPTTLGGKDRLFFFASYDGLRQFLPSSNDLATVPTLLMRNGNFSELLPSVQLRDPLTGLDIVGNRIDLLGAARINQAGLNYLRAFPLPNRPGLQQNYSRVRNQNLKQSVFDLRFDGNINDSNQAFVRGSYGSFDQTNDSRLETLPAGFGSGTNPTRTRGIVAGLNSSLTPTLFNELRLQANRIRYGYRPPFGDQPISANLGIVNANRDALLGGGALIGGYNGQLEYTGDFGEYAVPQNTYQLVDSLSYVRGNHTFKFGGSVIKRNVQLFRQTAAKGYFFLYGNGDFTQCRDNNTPESVSGTTRNEAADLLIGFACRYDIGFQNGLVGTINYENSAFFQDDYRVSSKLTLNLGLRYEYFTNPAEQYARQANFNLPTGSLILAKDGKDTLTQTDKNNFSPRAGFAYDIFGKGKSVVRAGYGIFYFLERGGIDNQLAQNPPFSGSSSYRYQDGYRITLTGQNALNSNAPSAAANNALPLPGVNLNPAFLANPVGANVFAYLPDNKTSNVQQFNVQFQQQLNNNTALSVGYVGTRGRNLSLFYNLNASRIIEASQAIQCPISGRAVGNCYPGIGSVNVRDDNGRSQYDSLQIQLQRRFTNGLQYIAAYTFSKTKDNGEGAFDSVGDRSISFIEPYTTSRLDYPHVFSFAANYDIPFGRGRQFGSNIPKALDILIGGFQLAPIFRAQSGNPFDVRNGGVRVDLIGDPYTGSTSGFLNQAAFRAAPTGRFGNLERNSLRSPATYQLNLGLLKDFNFTETIKFQFRAEAFNLFNTPQFTNPNTDFQAIGSGVNTGLTGNTNFGFLQGTNAFANRQFQFGARLQF